MAKDLQHDPFEQEILARYQRVLIEVRKILSYSTLDNHTMSEIAATLTLAVEAHHLTAYLSNLKK